MPETTSNETITTPTIPATYMVTEQDALQYSRHCMVGTLLLLGGYALAVAGVLPIVGLVALVALVLPRWMINVHELLHIYDHHQLNRFICLMGVSPVPLSVITLSYGEIRQQHLAHHRHALTHQDPDLYHIHGPWWRVVLNAFTTPEQGALHWIAAEGLNLQLGLDLVIKLGVLIYLAWWGGITFLWFWLSLRLVYGLGDLAFFRLVHNRQGETGSFPITPPLWLRRLSTLIYGITVTEATLNHDIHHQNPYVAARCLTLVRASGQLQPHATS